MKSYLIIGLILCLYSLSLAQTTLNKQVSASADDATQADVTMATLTNGNAPLRLYSSGQRWGGSRFTSVTIPKGATIISASITINDTLGAKVIDVTIYGENADNAAAFTTTNSDISNRTRTSSSVEWDVASTTTGENTSGDIKDPIQTIVNRSSWASGNAMVIIIALNANNTCASRSWDGNASKACKLAVTYRVGRRIRKAVFF